MKTTQRLALGLSAMVLTMAASAVIGQETEAEPSEIMTTYMEMAETTPHEELRVEIMKSNGQMLRGAMSATGDDAISAAEHFVAAFTVLPTLFDDPDTPGDALPLVWENNEEFLSIFADGLASAEVALEAAQGGDMDAYTAAMQEIGGTCRTCHGQFRAD